MTELLATKLFIPRPRSNRVSRPRLTERLNAGLDRKLTLIAAPAGFGKTTLLSEWIPNSPRCVTWLSLDEGDNDPTRFWVYVIASLQQLRPDLGNGAFALLQSSQAPPITSILTALINGLAAFPDAFCIVLDDYHLIEFQPIHEALNFLIAHLPANMHLVLTTRVDPPLPLARLRARHNLTELRANDLRFTAGETATFLNQTVGLNLSAKEVAALEMRTEGWIAGLQIAALSMQGRNDIPEFIRAFSGSHRHILGYLAAEVLDQQSEGTLNFLLKTSILDRLCGPLCDAVTGGSGGQALLESLEHANLFITPLDDEGRWYRYHHLFAEVLQARLRQNQPGLPAQLHRRASEWLERSGLVSEAIEHAISAADYSRAGQLIARTIPSYIYRGELKAPLNWINRLPEEHVFTNGELLSYEGWLLYITGQIDQARKYADKAQEYINPDTASPARGRLAYLNSQLAIVEGHFAAANEYALEALDLIGEEDLFFRSLALSTLSGIQQLVGSGHDTINILREAARIGEKLGQPLATLSAYVNLADQLNWRGELREGRAICEHAISLCIDRYGQPSPIAGIAYVEAAKLAYEEDDIDVLRQYLRAAIAQEELLGMIGLTLEIMYVQILIERIKGDIDAALAMSRRGYHSAEQAGLKGYLSIFAAIEASLLLKIGKLVAVEHWIETANLSTATGDDVLHIPENIVFVRYLMIQNHTSDAHEFLERLESTVSRAGYIRYLITIVVLKAILFQRQGDSKQAIENLERALQLAAPQNYRRAFLDEGEPIRLLLLDYQSVIRQRISDRIDSESLQLLTYTDKLLTAFSQLTPIVTQEDGTILEPLSQRELEILRLIQAGFSNQEIAEQLVIATSTVKTHINSLYGKFGVHSRTQAIAAALHLGVLSN